MTALFVIGIAFSGLSFWQQKLSDRSATRDKNEAVQREKLTIAQTVREEDKLIFERQSTSSEQLLGTQAEQIAALKEEIRNQGKDVHAIAGNQFLSGKRPVDVHVTNPLSVQSGGRDVSERAVGHFRISSKATTSDREAAPFRTWFTVAADQEFAALHFLFLCDGPIDDAQPSLTNSMMFSTDGTLTANGKGLDFLFRGSSIPFGPSNPLNIVTYSRNSVSCTFTEQ